MSSKLIKHPDYEGMYYIEWDDETLSKDFVNETRAKEYIRLEEDRLAKINPRMPSRASTEARGEFNGDGSWGSSSQ